MDASDHRPCPFCAHDRNSFLGIVGAACGSDTPRRGLGRSLSRTACAEPPRVLQHSEGLPRWLTEKPTDYMWERNNMWMMFSAVATGTRDRTLLALYNREGEADGPRGTSHLVAQAAKCGFKPIELDARELLKS